MPKRPTGYDGPADQNCDNECPLARPCNAGQKTCSPGYHSNGCPKPDVCVDANSPCQVSCPTGFLSCGGFIVSYGCH